MSCKAKSLPQNHPVWRLKGKWVRHSNLWIKYHQWADCSTLNNHGLDRQECWVENIAHNMAEDSGMPQKPCGVFQSLDHVASTSDRKPEQPDKASLATHWACTDLGGPGPNAQTHNKTEKSILATTRGRDEIESLEPCLLMGLIVRKKLCPLAVDRNRIKRRLRHALWHSWEKHPCAWQPLNACIVMVQNASVAHVPFQVLVQILTPHSSTAG